MQNAAKRKSLFPVSVDGSAVPGGSAPAGLPCGSLSRRLPHASAAAVRVLLLLVVTLCLGETRVWGFGITAPPASGVFESANPSSIGENTIGSGYVASDSLLAAKSADEFVNLASSQRTTHILTGDATGGGHLFPGGAGKSAFPQSYSADRVMHQISDVATDPLSSFVTGRGGRTVVNGTRDGIDLRVILGSPREGGGIITGFPTNVPRNP